MAKLHLCREGDRSKPVVILIHGLNGHFLDSWRRADAPPDACWPHWLSEDSGCDVYLLEYDASLSRWQNQAMPLPDQGDQVADLLSVEPKLAERQLVLIGHSMGGLVARSACHYGAEAGHGWLAQLRRIVFLGTPHHGAPLERAGHWVDVLLGSTPYSRPFARLGQLRSSGITDLRYGHVLDTDWQGRDRFRRSPDRRTPVPLPAGVACFTVAATLAARCGPAGPSRHAE